MKYEVPKFLERETKFFNFFTFKQLAIAGSLGLTLFILYYIIPRGIFIPLALLSSIATLSLMFLRINGIPLYQLVTELFAFAFNSRKYIWQKRTEPSVPRVKLSNAKKEEKKDNEESALKIASESRIRKLSSKIEMGEDYQNLE